MTVTRGVAVGDRRGGLGVGCGVAAAKPPSTTTAPAAATILFIVCPFLGVYAQTPEISVLERSRAAGDRFEVPVVTGKSAPARVWHTIPPDRFVRAYHEGCDGERPLAYGHFPVFDRWHKGLCGPPLWLSAQGDSSNLPIIGSFPESSRAGKA